MLENNYDKIAEKWHDNSRGQVYLERTLNYVDEILEGLLPKAKVLDLGCGTGKPIAKYIVEQGFQVVGIDQSAELLKIAKTVVPEAELVHADMIEIEFAEKFAAAVAWDSVFHVERKYHAGIYKKIVESIETGARFLLSVGGSGAEDNEANGITSEMFGYEFFYDAYHPTIARKLLEEAGFEIELWEIDDPSSLGHIAVIARKAA